VKSDGPLDLRIDCTKAIVKAARCSSSVTLRLPRVKGARVTRAVVKHRGHVLKRAKGRNLRTLTLRRASRKAFSVRIELTTTSKNKRITLVRRMSRC
jgi:uncharacterized protein GlcG (DUF336 family)